MKKILILIIIILYPGCSFNKIVHNHGVHNLEKKQSKLKINYTNLNEIIQTIGPPSTRSSFDNDILIYIERKTSSSKLSRLGKKKLLTNNVLVLQVNTRGLLIAKNFYNKDDMKKIDFDKDFTQINTSQKSFIYNFIYSIRQKIDDPLGKKRIKN